MPHHGFRASFHRAILQVITVMDFERIKQNLRFRSGRTSSKPFSTREPDRDRHDRMESPETLQLNPRRKFTRTPILQQQSTELSKPLSEVKAVTTSSSQNPVPTLSHHVHEEGQTTPVLTRNQSGNTSAGDADYDLRPPPLSSERVAASCSSLETVESLSELLFSEGYLRALTTDSQLLTRFTAFLDQYKPEISQVVLQYLETQKVLKAVDYANAVASSLKTRKAAEISAAFKSHADDIFLTLHSVALPAWVTYNLVKASTSCLLAEVTNQTTPLTRNLVRGLSEVFCLTDPNQEDNPIVYVSQEFYRLTGYGRKEVIGFNCRFLQGPKTDPKSVERLGKAIENGEEHSEMLLNYRRDGRPFINVLMMAPLYDDKGKVKYFLGAQLDATPLVETGRGVDGFEQFLQKREMESRRGARKAETDPKQVTLAKLRDLSLSFDLEESAVVQTSSRRSSVNSDREYDDSVTDAPRSNSGKRIILSGCGTSGNDESDGDKDVNGSAWNLSRDMPSGRLPTTYRNYVLVRPFPSLRIVFASQTAKKMGDLVQHPFLSHIAAPASTLSALKETFETMTPVTAQVALMRRQGEDKYGTTTGKWGGNGDDPTKYGKICWISATPLFDCEGAAGVWMVVIVDSSSSSRHNNLVTMDTSLRGGALPVVQSNGSNEADYSPQKLFHLLQQKAQNDAAAKSKPSRGLTATLDEISADNGVVREWRSTLDDYGLEPGPGNTWEIPGRSARSESREAPREADNLSTEANSSTECLNGSLTHEGPPATSHLGDEDLGTSREQSLSVKRGRSVIPVASIYTHLRLEPEMSDESGTG